MQAKQLDDVLIFPIWFFDVYGIDFAVFKENTLAQKIYKKYQLTNQGFLVRPGNTNSYRTIILQE